MSYEPAGKLPMDPSVFTLTTWVSPGAGGKKLGLKLGPSNPIACDMFNGWMYGE